MGNSVLWQVILLILVAMTELAGAATCPVTDSNCACHYDTHNILTSITCNGLGQRETLPTFSPFFEIIPTVRIENSTIYRLQRGVFSGLRIRNLLLNSLGMSIVEQHAFQGLEPYLESLEIRNSRFVSLPDYFLVNFTSLKTLALDRNELGLVKANWFVNMASLQYLSLTGNLIRDIEVQSFDSMPQLRVLYMTENKLSYLNKDLFSKLTQLRVLWLGSNNITVLPISIFSSLTNLEFLDMNHNQLTTLPVGLFKDTHKLQKLYVSSNSIQEIGPENLPPVSLLEVLVLSNNNISVLRESSFINVNKLKTLALDNNHIDKLPDLAFENLQELDILDLQDNNIGELPQNILVGLLQLTKLNLNHNRIKVLTYGVFDPLGRLVWLDISNNQVSLVHFGPFDALRNLKFLDLSRNLLSEVATNWFRKVGSLVELRLDHNGIRSIDDDSFSRMPKLQTLLLEHNYIQELSPTMFSATRELQVLSLFHNPLKVVPTRSFASLQQLQKLYLNYTCLTALPNELFANLGSVKELRLDHTPIGVIETYSFTPLTGLETLILGHHNLTTIEARPFIQLTITKLTADNMHLSHNDLANLLIDLPNASQISLKYNLITSLPRTIFSSNSQLQELSLLGNPLVCDCQLGWLRNFEALVDIENTVCAGPSSTIDEKAACFPLPQGCPSNASLFATTQKCLLPSSVNSEQPELNYGHCIVPPIPTTALPTTTTTTAMTTLGPLVISVTNNQSVVIVTWDHEVNENVIGYRVGYRVFATDVIKNSPDLSVNDTMYHITDLEPGRKYLVCVDIKLVTGYVLNKGCKEIDFNYGVAIMKTEPKKDLQLLVIVSASAAAIIVIFIIIVIIVCCLRKTKTRFSENAKRKEQEDQMVKDKMGMWVNTFNYDGNVQESMGEQMMLDYDIFSGNNPTVSKARYAQMVAEKGRVMPDVLAFREDEMGSSANNALPHQALDMGDEVISHSPDKPQNTVLPEDDFPQESNGGSDPGYGESEAGYNGSDTLQDDHSKDIQMLF